MSVLMVIELGDITVRSQTPLNEMIWFVVGLILLAGSSTAVLWWNRRTRKDPFI